MRLKLVLRAIALLGVVAIVATACGGGKKTNNQASGTPSSTITKGGSIVIGAEQWPECVNPINQCSAATWYWYSVGIHVVARAMVLDLHGNFIASPMLVEAPTLDNGGVTQSPFTIKFKISALPSATSTMNARSFFLSFFGAGRKRSGAIKYRISRACFQLLPTNSSAGASSCKSRCSRRT